MSAQADRQELAALEAKVSALEAEIRSRDADLERAEDRARALAANADRLADALSALRGRAG